VLPRPRICRLLRRLRRRISRRVFAEQRTYHRRAPRSDACWAARCYRASAVKPYRRAVAPLFQDTAWDVAFDVVDADRGTPVRKLTTFAYAVSPTRQHDSTSPGSEAVGGFSIPLTGDVARKSLRRVRSAPRASATTERLSRRCSRPIFRIPVPLRHPFRASRSAKATTLDSTAVAASYTAAGRFHRRRLRCRNAHYSSLSAGSCISRMTVPWGLPPVEAAAHSIFKRPDFPSNQRWSERVRFREKSASGVPPVKGFEGRMSLLPMIVIRR